MSTILIVDDLEQNRYLLRAMLTASGDEALEAANGVEALELARRTRLDLIISDILMPQMDGFALCRECKRDKQLRDIPFIFYTATYTDPRDEALALQLGAARFIVKPIESEDFIAIVGEVLQAHAAGQLAAPPTPLEEETVFYRLYNETLIRKLEDKMLELESLNRSLVESEDRFRRMSENAQDLISRYEFTPKRGFTYVSPAATTITGFTPEEYYADPDLGFKLVHPDDRSLLAPLVDGKTEPFQLLTLRWMHKDGRIIWIEQRNVPVFNEAGELIAIEGIARDITERKHAEEELQETRELLNNILEHAPMSIYVTLADGRLLLVNQQWEQDTQKQRGEVIGSPLDHVFPIEQAEKFNADNRRVVESGATLAFEEAIETPVGERQFLTVKFPLRDTIGQITAVVGISIDITERRRAEEERETLRAQLTQAQKMESVGRLAGGVAHDFNNMLGIILGHTEMAINQVGPAQPVFAHLQGIRKAAERSADLTRQLLAFARKQTVAPKVLDLNETLEGMLKMLRRLIGEDIDLAWRPGSDLWPIKIDPSQIDQMLVNLCVNARDAIAEVGKVTIETSNVALDVEYCANHVGFIPGEYVKLAVSDNGCGMTQDILVHLFEPFYTTKVFGKGTGLGLATVYGIVKQNNGFINVYSEPDHGTTFKIYLPRHVGKAEQIQTKGPTETVSRGNETVLLVEDEPALLDMGKWMLESFGYRVLAAGTPGEAIRLAEEHAGEIHLLMTDVVMPEMNGRDLAKRLLSLYPHLKRLFMSGYTSNVIAHHDVLDEGVHFIQKPFSMKDMAAKVREVLEQ